jgi:hypothetical protein
LVSGGAPAKQGEHPWQASIRVQGQVCRDLAFVHFTVFIFNDYPVFKIAFRGSSIGFVILNFDDVLCCNFFLENYSLTKDKCEKSYLRFSGYLNSFLFKLVSSLG